MSFFATRRLIWAAPLVLILLTCLLRPAAAEELAARPGDVVLGQADAPITMVNIIRSIAPIARRFTARFFRS